VQPTREELLEQIAELKRENALLQKYRVWYVVGELRARRRNRECPPRDTEKSQEKYFKKQPG
jgi:hypothetical protein